MNAKHYVGSYQGDHPIPQRELLVNHRCPVCLESPFFWVPGMWHPYLHWLWITAASYFMSRICSYIMPIYQKKKHFWLPKPICHFVLKELTENSNHMNVQLTRLNMDAVRGLSCWDRFAHNLFMFGRHWRWNFLMYELLVFLPQRTYKLDF